MPDGIPILFPPAYCGPEPVARKWSFVLLINSRLCLSFSMGPNA
jgi:hypothetical protein